MAECKFCHLHLHTHYSLLDGFNRIPPLVEQTKKLGMTACAITDHGNLYGAIEFYTECKKGGINPIIGYEAYLAPGDRTREEADTAAARPYYHLTLLAKNNDRLQEPHQAVVASRSSKASTTTRASTARCSKRTARGSSA